jgi:hypothetical protein
VPEGSHVKEGVEGVLAQDFYAWAIKHDEGVICGSTSAIIATRVVSDMLP